MTDGNAIVPGGGENPYTRGFAVAVDGKDHRSRLKAFEVWLTATKTHWHDADLARYRDYLLRERKLAPHSASAHLASIRARYRSLLRSNDLRKTLYGYAPEGSDADRKAFVDEIVIRLRNIADPDNSKVKLPTIRDYTDSEHRRLTPEEGEALIEAPFVQYGDHHPRAIRDGAIIALLYCTGLRVAELTALVIDDLYQTLDGYPSIRVRKGKGMVQRVVPYGSLDWCLGYVETWRELYAVNAPDEPVFSAFVSQNYDAITREPLSTWSVEALFAERYRLPDGTRISVHDLRRTYAWQRYEEGMKPESIQDNLGHALLKTTMGYIGKIGTHHRVPGLNGATPTHPARRVPGGGDSDDDESEG